MAKPNYSFEKRQRDLEKKRKQEEKLEEKRRRKLAEKSDDAGDASPMADEGRTHAPDSTPV